MSGLPREGAMALVEERFLIGDREIVAPHSFEFQLDHYVIAPETRQDETLVQIFRLGSGRLVKVDVVSRGSVDAPLLELTVRCDEPVADSDLAEIRERITWHLWLDEDLRPFYQLVEEDPVLSASVAFNHGGKAKSSFTMFDAIVDCICAQNTFFRRLYAMRANLAQAFGDELVADGRAYHASPTPGRLAGATVEQIRACGVGYRDRYIKQLAEAVVDGVDLEAIRLLPHEEARDQLMTLPGVGPYTADLSLIIGARRRDWMPLDVYIREALRTFYFAGETVPDDALRAFAADRWGDHQGHAAFYLTTNTERWVEKAGMRFRLTSGALSNPGDP